MRRASEVDGTRCAEAVAALYSSLHQSRSPEALERASRRRTRTVQDMRTYMKRVDLEVPSRIPVVHVTGTKGKGSTCVMCEAILRGRYGKNTGLFTSPHLVDIRERIRVNGKPVSKAVFSEAYFELRRRLERGNDHDDDDDLPVLPGYFRMGGRYDATNILNLDGTRHVACGVTLLDYDHERVLGSILEQIAWEKGGIFQVNKGTDLTTRPNENDQSAHAAALPEQSQDVAAPASKEQFFALGTNTESALEVLRTCARVEGRGQELHLVNEGRLLPAGASIGLNGPHQRINAEMAIALCNALIKGSEDVQDLGVDAAYQALNTVSWPGRCQMVNVKWPSEVADHGIPMSLYLDGAHTSISLAVGASWFQGQSTENDRPVLIFNCSHERDPIPLLELLSSCRPCFSKVYFCRADFERPSTVGKAAASHLLRKAGFALTETAAGRENPASWQETLAELWRYLGGESVGAPLLSGITVREALEDIGSRIASTEAAEQSSSPLKVFITGSLYIVGSALDAVGWSEEAATGTLRATRKASQ